jgi:hypothetical protein
MLTLAFLTATGLATPSAPGPAPESMWFGGLPMALPEASSLALLIVGLAVVGVIVRRRHARIAADTEQTHDDEQDIQGQAGQL